MLKLCRSVVLVAALVMAGVSSASWAAATTARLPTRVQQADAATACALTRSNLKAVGKAYSMHAKLQHDWEYGELIVPVGCDRGMLVLTSPEVRALINEFGEDYLARCGSRLLSFDLLGTFTGTVARDEKPMPDFLSATKVRAVRFVVLGFEPANAERPLGECPA